ncbi:hypothetical protein ACHAC9_13195 [Massilia sp. CMS3.1]|uniref:hypothetical protein n=1 Tax=Massilia sp. CMS3.1 TaxID=3373083 RepID=UPI003EE43957
MRAFFGNGEIMTISSASERMQDNVLRQAKRLKHQLDIPLTPAKEILATTAYRCANWRDLLNQIEAGSDNPALSLALLPESMEGQSYLSSHIRRVALGIGRRVLTNCNLAGVYQIVRRVFELTGADVGLADVSDKLEILQWRPANIGPDPHAVVETTTVANGLPVKLIGTRVYLPEYFDFGENLQSVVSCAVNGGDRYEIMWSSPRAWYEATYVFLSQFDGADDDDDVVPMQPPHVELDQAMQRHAAWFEAILQLWDEKSRYGGDKDMAFLPVVTSTGCYLVFGVPASPDSVALWPQVAGADAICDEGNDSQIAVIDEPAVCVDWVHVPATVEDGDQWLDEYHQSLRRAFLGDRSAELVSINANGPRSFLFVRPASRWDIHMALKVELVPKAGRVLCVVKTDHVPLAAEVLEKVANHELSCYTSQFGHQRYIMELDVSRHGDKEGFSLALDVQGQSMSSASNLVTTAIWSDTGDGQCKLYLEVSD